MHSLLEQQVPEPHPGHTEGPEPCGSHTSPPPSALGWPKPVHLQPGFSGRTPRVCLTPDTVTSRTRPGYVRFCWTLWGNNTPAVVMVASLAAQLVKNLPAMQETCVWSLGWQDPLEKEKEKGYSLQYSGLENSMGCTVHGIAKSRTWLSDLHFHLLWCLVQSRRLTSIFWMGDAHMDVWMNAQMDSQVDPCMHTWMDNWIGGWMDACMDGWRDG